jgi:hypothetical protein
LIYLQILGFYNNVVRKGRQFGFGGFGRGGGECPLLLSSLLSPFTPSSKGKEKRRQSGPERTSIRVPYPLALAADWVLFAKKRMDGLWASPLCPKFPSKVALISAKRPIDLGIFCPRMRVFRI